MGVSTSPAQSVVAAPHQVGGSMTLPASFKAPRCRYTKLLFWFTREVQHKGSRPCNHNHYELTFTQHSQSVLRAKNMILMLLYGLEMFLCVCGMSSNYSKTSNGRGEAYIYRPPSLVAVAPTVSRKSVYHRMNRCFCLG